MGQVAKEVNMDKIIKLINKLCSEYFNKYCSEPNAVLINEQDLAVVEQIETVLYKDCMAQPTYLLGLKIIPKKHGEMEVVELL